MFFKLMDRLGVAVDKRGLRGEMRKTFLYPVWKWVRALPLHWDYRMVNLYSRESFRNLLDDRACSNWISMWIQSYQKPPETSAWVLDLEDPVPWINFKAVCYMEFFLLTRRDPVVFEYGSGGSTLWFAKRAAKVVSCEHDEEWYGAVRHALESRRIENVTYCLEPGQPIQSRGATSHQKYQSAAYQDLHFENYVKKIEDGDHQYDLILVDGVARQACLELAKHRAKSDGIIILDNSSRERYQDAINNLADWRSVRMSGPASYGAVYDETTLFFRT